MFLDKINNNLLLKLKFKNLLKKNFIINYSNKFKEKYFVRLYL